VTVGDILRHLKTFCDLWKHFVLSPRLEIKEDCRLSDFLSDHIFLADRSEEKPGQAHACHDQKMPEKSETNEHETCL
jgi:hypothetical protein